MLRVAAFKRILLRWTLLLWTLSKLATGVCKRSLAGT